MQLRLSGPAVFAVGARAKIEHAAVRLSIASSLLVVTLLLLPSIDRCRRSRLGLVPVATGALFGIAAVALGFGAVHGITLGFRHHLDRRVGRLFDLFFRPVAPPRQVEPAAASWQRAWWPTIRLGMLTSVCGFASLLPSGFPGLAATRALLDQRPDCRRLGDPLRAAGAVAGRVRDSRCRAAWARVSPERCSGRSGSGAWQLAGLSAAARGAGCDGAAPASGNAVESRALGIEPDFGRGSEPMTPKLRADLGAADVARLVIVSGADMDAALCAAPSALARALQPLVESKVIGGFESPANYLAERGDAGSAARQSARRRGTCATIYGKRSRACRCESNACGLFLRMSKRRATRRW